MKLVSHTFESDFCSISKVARSLVINFVIFFSVPCCLVCFSFELFLIYKFVSSQFLVFCFIGVVVGWELFSDWNFSRVQNFRSLRKFVGLFSPNLPTAANPPFPVHTISFLIFLFQPFNRAINGP